MRVTVICDASYCPNHRVAGYGFWIACERSRYGGEGTILDEVENTNTAEMMAVCNSIWHGVSKKVIQPGDDLLVQTDSMSAIDRFRGRDVKISEQQQIVLSYYEKAVSRLQLVVRFKHVQGHSTNTDARFIANRMCDKRAKDQMRAARRAKIVSKIREEHKDIFA